MRVCLVCDILTHRPDENGRWPNYCHECGSWLDRARILSKASDGSPPQIDLLMDMQGFLHQEGLVGAEGQEDELGLELCEAPLADGIEGLGDAELAS